MLIYRFSRRVNIPEVLFKKLIVLFSGDVDAGMNTVDGAIENQTLKGLGHAILGNFSIDEMVIELNEIPK